MYLKSIKFICHEEKRWSYNYFSGTKFWKKTAVKFAWRYFFKEFNKRRGRYKEGGPIKISEINKRRGDAYLALQSMLRTKNNCGTFSFIFFFFFTAWTQLRKEWFFGKQRGTRYNNEGEITYLLETHLL